MKALLLFFLSSVTIQLHAQTGANDTVGIFKDDTTSFTKVEVEASVNPIAWRQHLVNNLGTVVDSASSVLKPGTYTVLINFIVEKDGKITNVRALNDPGYGIGQLAAEVVKKGPRWRPARIKKKPVRSYYTQPVTFVIQED